MGVSQGEKRQLTTVPPQNSRIARGFNVVLEVLSGVAFFLQKGQNVLIAAHGNSLRALVKYLDNMTDEAIMALNIPTGEPQNASIYAGMHVPTNSSFVRWPSGR